MNTDDVMKNYRDVNITQLLAMMSDFKDAITKAPTTHVPTFPDDESLRQIADESIMALWGKIWDNVLSLVVYEWAKGVFFRTDDTLHYIFNDSETAHVWVCEYVGWWEGKQMFKILDIEKSGGD